MNRIGKFLHSFKFGFFVGFSSVILAVIVLLSLQVGVSCKAPNLIDQWARCTVTAETINVEFTVSYHP